MKKIEKRPIAGARRLTPLEMSDCHLSLGHSPLRPQKAARPKS